MTSRFSNVSKAKNAKSKFKKYYVHEVASNLTEAKLIANDISETKRYPYRAAVTLVGDTNVRPYEPIYLDGLPNGMSGYWTVLKVRHVFGGLIARHLMEVVVGTDVIGDVNPDAYKAAETRNVTAELAGQNIGGSNSVLLQYTVPINNTALVDVPVSSVNISLPANFIQVDTSSPDLYQNDVPDFSAVKQEIVWKAVPGGNVV